MKKVSIFLERTSEIKFVSRLTQSVREHMDVEFVVLMDRRNDLSTLEALGKYKVLASYLERLWYFKTLDSDFLITTVPGLEKAFFKRTGVGKTKYVYLPHSLISLSRNYKRFDFAHYDLFLSPSPYHTQEIRWLERSERTKKKSVIAYGYEPVLDLASRSVKINSSDSKTILIAPSWKDVLGSFESCVRVIRLFLEDGWNVIYRPHELTIVDATKVQNVIDNHRLFRMESGNLNMESLLAADILLTDVSGVAYEYSMALSRPVLFVESESSSENHYHFEDAWKSASGVRTSMSQANEMTRVANLLRQRVTSNKLCNLIYPAGQNVHRVCRFLEQYE